MDYVEVGVIGAFVEYGDKNKVKRKERYDDKHMPEEDIPSCSLGLGVTQLKDIDECDLETTPRSTSDRIFNKELIMERFDKRKPQLSCKFKSPNIDRKVDISKKVMAEELKIRNYIVAGKPDRKKMA